MVDVADVDVTHIYKRQFLKWCLVGQGKTVLLHMCLTWGTWFWGWSFPKPLSIIGVENEHFYPKKDGLVLKLIPPTFQAPKMLRTCQMTCQNIAKGDFEQNRSRSMCFQVQPVSWWCVLIFLYVFEVYSIVFFKTIGNLPKVFEFEPVISHANRLICNWRWHLPVRRS